jgi:maltose/moltooligosaccharide transporter
VPDHLDVVGSLPFAPGARIPFMLYTTAPLAICLTLMGVSPGIATWMRSISPHLFGTISAASLTIALISFFLVGYKFFDTFPQSVYYYLYTDVIPPQLMGTFVCLFRMCSTLGVFVFNKFFLRYCDDYPGVICAGAGALYFASFMMLCFQVKEGQYPAPEPTPSGSLGRRTLRSVSRFFRECYTIPFYWKYYLFTLCFMIGFVPFRKFMIFYGQKDMHMSLASYGNMTAVRDIVQVGVFLMLGPLVDRVHPLRAGLAGLVLVFVSALLSFLFIGSAASFGVWTVILFSAVAVYQGATGALGPRILPRSHYGQFCAASALVFHFGQMLLAPVLGRLTDVYGNVAIYPWFFGFAGAGILLLSMVYRDWKKLGGDAHYIPPLRTDSPEERAFEVVTRH